MKHLIKILLSILLFLPAFGSADENYYRDPVETQKFIEKEIEFCLKVLSQYENKPKDENYWYYHGAFNAYHRSLVYLIYN